MILNLIPNSARRTGKRVRPLLASGLAFVAAFAFAAESLAQPQGSQAASVASEAEGPQRKEVEDFLSGMEDVWNKHQIEDVMANYADDYINNDGIDKSTVRTLTEEFWKTYPDVRSSSATKHIRIDGVYATVDSRDTATGTTATEFATIKSKGELQSISEGQLYLKKAGGAWKIIGDRIDFEKVKVAFGLAKQLSASFTAPEQIKSGKQFTAKLEVSLPPGLHAVGSISNQPLKYPQGSTPDTPRVLDGSSLERVMNANSENCNELLTARVLLTNPSREKVLGVSVFTRRLNVVPDLRPDLPVGHKVVDSKQEIDHTRKDAPGELPKKDGTKETIKEIIKKKEEPGADHPPDVTPSAPLPR